MKRCWVLWPAFVLIALLLYLLISYSFFLFINLIKLIVKLSPAIIVNYLLIFLITFISPPPTVRIFKLWGKSKSFLYGNLPTLTHITIRYISKSEIFIYTVILVIFIQVRLFYIIWKLGRGNVFILCSYNNLLGVVFSIT